MVDTRAEMKGPQKRGTEGRDSCLDTACQLVRGSQMVRLQTEMQLGCRGGQYLFVVSLGTELDYSYRGLSPRPSSVTASAALAEVLDSKLCPGLQVGLPGDLR